MADTKITNLTSLSALAYNDLLLGVDVSDITQGASGTTKKVLLSNLFDVFNVKHYGDTTTDATAAVQAAVTAASGSTYGIVYFPPGTYTLTGTITGVSSQLLLQGAGRFNTRIQVASTFSGAIFADSGFSHSWLQIRDMSIRTPSGQAAAAVFYQTTPGTITLEAIFENLHINRIGVPFKGTFNDCKWLNCKIVACDFAGFWFTETGDHGATIENVDVESADYGIYFSEGAHYGSIHLVNFKQESNLATALYRNVDSVVEVGCVYGPGVQPPIVCETVGRYQGSYGDKVRSGIPVHLNDLDLPNWITDGDMALSGTAAWTASNATLLKISDNLMSSGYVLGNCRKHNKMLQVTATATDGYVQQTINDISPSYYFFTCLYAVEDLNDITIEVLDNLSNVLIRKVDIAYTDWLSDYVPRFYRLSGSFDAGAATTLTVRFTSGVNGKRIWLNEVVLCENYMDRGQFLSTGTFTDATLTTNDTTVGHFYTEPAGMTISKTVAADRSIRCPLPAAAAPNDNEQYLVWARVKAPLSTSPNIQVYAVGNTSDIPSTTLYAGVEGSGWIDTAMIINGENGTSGYMYIKSLANAAGDTYIDAVAVVPLGSKHADPHYPTYRAQQIGLPYTIVEGPECDISAAGSTLSLYYPHEHYQLHKIELVYTVAPDNTNSENLLIGTAADDDYYMITDIKGTEAQWASREVTPLRSDVRRNTPIFVKWVQDASQTATVRPYLYLR